MASIVHNPGRQQQVTSTALHDVLRDIPSDSIITDAEAQTIAAMWHSPDSPNSTLLSTMGKVSSDISILDFGNPALYRGYAPKGHESEDHNRFMSEALTELEALDKYIRHYQQFPTTPTGVHPCACDDCPNMQYGRSGDLCEHCEEAGCSGEACDACECDDLGFPPEYSECND